MLTDGKIRDLQKRFQEISPRCDPEVREFISQLLFIIERSEEVIKSLEAKLSLNSHNSHKPPSTDGPKKGFFKKALYKSNGNKPGGQRGHKGETLKMVDDPQEVIIYRVRECKTCQKPLQDIEPARIKRQKAP